MEKLQKILIPIGEKLSNQRHIAAISKGLMATVSLSIIGAIMQILANPPITQEIIDAGGFFATILGPWFNFAQANQTLLMTPYNMTMGLFSVIIAFSIAYNLAQSYKMSGLLNGITGMLMFLMITTPMQNYTVLVDGVESTISAIETGLLGSPGMFAAIVVAVASVEITNLCVKRNWVVKLPDVVPPSLADSFTSMIPLILNVIIIYGLNAVCLSVVGASLPHLIIGLLMAPLQAVNSVVGVILLITFAALLWIMGIHGTMIIYPIIMPLLIEAIMTNAALVQAGQPAVFSPIMLFSAVQAVGGTGNTLALSIMSSRSKSKQLSAIGKISIGPAVFGINEPMIFGAPIMFNPILAIPFVLSPAILAIAMYISFKVGFSQPGYILILSLLPIGVSGFLSSMNIKNFLLDWVVLLPITFLLYYPFFKVYEKQLLDQEAQTEVNV